MKPTDQASRDEWLYRFEERLGILTQGEAPTPDEVKLARAEADEAVRLLKLTHEARTQTAG